MLKFLNKALDQKSARNDKSSSETFSSKDQKVSAQDEKALSDAELSQVAGGRMLNPQPLPPRYR